MNAIEINYRLRMLGKSQAAVARDLGVGSGVVNNVIHSRITSLPIAAYIAGLLETTPEILWPDRYPIKPRASAKVEVQLNPANENSGGQR